MDLTSFAKIEQILTINSSSISPFYFHVIKRIKVPSILILIHLQWDKRQIVEVEIKNFDQRSFMILRLKHVRHPFIIPYTSVIGTKGSK